MTISSPKMAVNFTIESKYRAHVSADQVINQLNALAEGSPHPLLFVGEYVNPPLRRACEKRAISYVDPTGWAYVVSDEPPILIRTEGASRPPIPRENTPTTRLNGPAAGRAIRCLLELDPPLGIRQLAKRSSSSPAAVSKLMPTLVDAGAVDRSADGTVTRIRRRTLLDRWTADYSFMHSNGVLLDYLAPRGLLRVLEQIRGRDDLCVTGSAAGRTYLPSATIPVVPLTLLTLYSRDIARVADSLGLIRTDRGASNVIVTTPRDPELLKTPRLSAQGFPIAPIGQVLADLLTLPGRMAQEAEQIMESLAEKDPAWSE
ncbi:helix-turn-helix domain-containing protein [Kibdelosporangium lantanae]|uniref:Helix-turn-helix domain-containing protein n=1 Tax=Kibdelosporangium lantanae TaxID=1497396 RepID=A0ABW3M8N1_9PSEU